MTTLPKRDALTPLADLPLLDADAAGLCAIDPASGVMVCDLPAETAVPDLTTFQPTLPPATAPARPTGDSQ